MGMFSKRQSHADFTAPSDEFVAHKQRKADEERARKAAAKAADERKAAAAQAKADRDRERAMEKAAQQIADRVLRGMS